MVLRLRDATDADVPSIGRVSAAAFHPQTDPIARRLFPEHLRPPHLSDDDVQLAWRTARKGTSLKKDTTAVLVVEDSDLNGQVVGFAIWDKPDTGKASNELHGGEELPDSLDKEALTEMRAIVVGDQKVTFGERGTKDVWHLDYIGVDPRHKRRGIGNILLQWGIEQAAKEGRDCYLVATPAGRPFYEASGFKVLRILKIFGVDHYSMILKHGAREGMAASK